MTVKRTRNQKWSAEELQFLRENASLGAAKLAEHLGASEHAIRQIASRQNIPLIVDWSHNYDFDCAMCGKTVTVQRLRNRKQRQTICDRCRQVKMRDNGFVQFVSLEQKMLHAAKSRAKKKGVPFALTVEDIVIPKFCPVLGIELKSAQGGAGHMAGDSSPTLDRIIPVFGYVPGNVAVISWRANKLKADGTLDELRKVAAWLSKHS